MLDERFARIAVVGTGMMGPGIALTLARGGCRVALYGRTEASKERGLARVDGALTFLVEHGVLEAREASALRAQIWGTTDLKPSYPASKRSGRKGMILSSTLLRTISSATILPSSGPSVTPLCEHTTYSEARPG